MARRDATNPPGSIGRDRRGDGADSGTSQSYGVAQSTKGHAVSHSVLCTLAAIVMWTSTFIGQQWETLSLFRPVAGILGISVVVTLFLRHRRRVAYLLFMCAGVGVVGGSWAWHGATPVIPGPCSGEAIVKTDPQRINYAIGVVVELQGRRYKAVSHGQVASRLRERLVGEHIFIKGMCEPLSGRFERFDRIHHVSGRIVISEVSEQFSEGSLSMRAANRMRRTMVNGVRFMPPDLRSLFTGLVIGDDRDQPKEMIQQFRASGLSHLCAVSGQNVAYLLAVMSPLLQRLRRLPRWGTTLFLLLWFVALARGEPSVLRASVMAGVVATNALRKNGMNARTVIALTVMTLLVVDPMLAWSVGFGLSVGATMGLAWWSSALTKMIGPRAGIAATLSAQLGTMPVSFLIFGYVPVISMIANPLALAVAGAVMMIGLPLAILGGLWTPAAVVVSWLMVVPVAWVAGVARIGASVSVIGIWNVFGWLCVAVFVAHRWRKSAHQSTPVAR